MTLQTIKSIDGKDEYVLLPMSVYTALREEIEDELAGIDASQHGERAYLLDGGTTYAGIPIEPEPVSMSSATPNPTPSQAQG